MQTKYWVVDKDVDKTHMYPQVAEAASLLKKNELVAFPTETVYGLGANALSATAAAKIYEAKGRPSDNPLIVHIASQEQIEELSTGITQQAVQLMEAFWPGALTLVVDKKDGALPDTVTAGLSTVAVRMPDHPLALELIREAGIPVAAPSANRSGKPSPTTASHVREDLDGRIAGILDGGETGIGVESTVIDCTSEIPVILRPGGITIAQIESVVGSVVLDPALKDQVEKPKAPGMKYKHYAPEAPMYIMAGSDSWIQGEIDRARSGGKKVGVLTTEEKKHLFQADVILPCGFRNHLPSVASSLYDVLRKFNESAVDVIYSEAFSQEGLGLAVMNRLEKAAGHRWKLEKNNKQI